MSVAYIILKQNYLNVMGQYIPEKFENLGDSSGNAIWWKFISKLSQTVHFIKLVLLSIVVDT